MNKNEVLEGLIDENISHLEMGIGVLSTISSLHYTFSEDSDSPWMSGIGKHFRHLIDFYDRFLDQFPVVNYDLRTRDTEIETSREAAKDKLGMIIGVLENYRTRDPDQKIDLFSGDIPMEKNRNKVSSTLGRELRYLIEHTVHHYAIIAMFLKFKGYRIPAGFGVAQSTLDYEAKLKIK